LKYLVEGDQLFYRAASEAPLRQFVDDPEEKKRILAVVHEELGHRGREGTYGLASARYYWTGLYEDCKPHVKCCPQCQFRDPRREEEALHPTWVSMIFEKIHIDVSHMPADNGKNYLLKARCNFSHWSEAHAIRSATADEVAKFLYEDFICHCGCPRRSLLTAALRTRR
jgi:hypothetical protein